MEWNIVELFQREIEYIKKKKRINAVVFIIQKQAAFYLYFVSISREYCMYCK